MTVLRLARYTKTPIGYFLDMPMGELVEWIEVANREAKEEARRAKESAKKGR